MHTTEFLRPEHFRLDASALFPGFDGSDRLGVVSPQPLDGILNAGYAVLACVTEFYTVHRNNFVDGCMYPPYFIFLAPESSRSDNPTHQLHVPWPSAAELWCHLDVWPDAQRIATDGSSRGFIENVVSRQVTRLLWPASLGIPGNTPNMPAALLALAQSQLRSVLLYGSDDANLDLPVAEPVENLIQRGVINLPELDAEAIAAFHSARNDRRASPGSWHIEGYRTISLDTFLNAHGS